MTDKEQHSTIKEMKKDGLILGMFGFIIAMVAGVFFFFGHINYGLILLSASIVSFFMTLLVAVKIHGRYVQELILKMNGKTWEEYCPCFHCLALQTSKSVEGSQKQDSVK